MSQNFLKVGEKMKKGLYYFLILLIIFPFNLIIASSAEASFGSESIESTREDRSIAPLFYIHTEAVNGVDTNSATITWHTNKPATSRVVYGLSPVNSLGSWPNLGYSDSTEESEEKKTFHKLTITGLKANSKYYFRAISQNSAKAFGKQLFFVTKKEQTEDIKVEALEEKSEQKADIEVVEEVVIENNEEIKEDNNLIYIDMDGDGFDSFRTPHPLFYTHTEKVEEVDNTSTTITWHTNKPATSRVVYGLSPVNSFGSWPNLGYSDSTEESEEKATFHKVAIVGLNPNSTYYFRAISAASPEIYSRELSFITNGVAVDVGEIGGNKDVELGLENNNIKENTGTPSDDNGIIGSGANTTNNNKGIGSGGKLALADNEDKDQISDMGDKKDNSAEEGAVCGIEGCPDSEDFEEENSGAWADWWWLIILVILVVLYFAYEKYRGSGKDEDKKPSSVPQSATTADKQERKDENFKQNHKDLKQENVDKDNT